MLNRRDMLLAVAGILAGGALARATPAAEKKEDKVKAELKKLQGQWQADSLETDGKKAPDKVVENARFEIKDNKMIEKGSNNLTELAIDPGKEPKAIDLTSDRVTRKIDSKTRKVTETRTRETVKGIYTLEGDTLTICLAPDPEAERPTKIESGKGLVLAVFKRKKP